jgi:hypothetical protein
MAFFKISNGKRRGQVHEAMQWSTGTLVRVGVK